MKTIPHLLPKRLTPALPALIVPALLLVFPGVSRASITVSSAEPSTDVLLDAINGGSIGGVINAGATQGARGTEFSLGTTGDEFNVSGFTIQANNPDTFAGGENFTVAVYSGSSGTFTAAGTFANVTPAYLDTNSGLTLISSETFAATSATGSSTGAGKVGNNEYVSFNFTNDISLDGGVTYTVIVFTDFAFSQREGNNNGGGRFSFRETTTTIAGGATRDFRFSVLGTDALALADPTISASENLIVAGDSVDLNITFDTNADTATVSTPGGAVDLLAIDAGDSIPNDGMVVVNDSPTSPFIYEVTASKSGNPVTADTAVLVAGLTDVAVYEDEFDNDGVATNTGVGGGGVSANFNGNDWLWTDDGNLTAGTAASGNRINIFNSLNAFNISDGFVLEVVFDMGATGTTPFGSNHLSLGLVEASGSSSLFESNGATPPHEGLGVSLTERNGQVDTGVIEWDFSAGLTTTQSGFTPSAGTGQTFILQVESDGTFTYSYGTEAGTGSTALDMSIPLFFQARTQGSSGNVIQRVSLQTSSVQFAAPTISPSATMIEVGDSVDLDITFATNSDTAILTTPSGVVDLIALDGSDATPGDGMVTVTESPVSSYTYDVTATKSGASPLSADVEIVVVDPSTEVPDNTFSSAIKVDSPLFYYRFEEGSNADALLDSSGNANHITSSNILGNVTFGSGPGGMQNAGDFDAASALLVPTSSAMHESYTFSAVINLDDSLESSTLGNILAMADGTGIGRSLFFSGAGGFQTFADGTASLLTDADAVAPSVTCLVHVVFDDDPDEDPGTLDSEMRVYVNGTLYSSTSLGQVSANVGDWVLASNKNAPSQSLLGWLDEAALFESALTDVQIAAHATAFFAAADPLLGFISDTTSTYSGDPVEFSWKTSDQASVVTINGTPVDGGAGGGIYTMSFNPTVDTTYTIDVDGETRDIMVTVLPSPEIVSFSADSLTPPNVTLVVKGQPNAIYNVTASSTLADFADIGETVETDANGDGTTTFPGEGTAEFYRLDTVVP